MVIMQYGFTPAMLPDGAEGLPARVTAVYRNQFEVISNSGSALAPLKAGVYFGGTEVFPTTGDFVLLDDMGRIVKTLPRKTYFARLDPSSAGRGSQAVAANFDYVFILQSLNNDFNPRRLERYLTLAWQSGAVPAVILTKADLADDYTEQVREAEKTAAGVAVFAVSAKTKEGLNTLSEFLKPRKTVVFLGSSGVGKSSLVNALAGEELMAVKDIREDDDKGRHTTTHRQLILLQSGVMIIDTPGMRELGMWDISDGLGQNFADVEACFGKCRFIDCQHESEPGCAVKAAIESGVLSLDRWESYRRLKAEDSYDENKEDYLRKKQQWHKNISKEIKNQKKYGDIRK